MLHIQSSLPPHPELQKYIEPPREGEGSDPELGSAKRGCLRKRQHTGQAKAALSCRLSLSVREKMGLLLPLMDYWFHYQIWLPVTGCLFFCPFWNNTRIQAVDSVFLTALLCLWAPLSSCACVNHMLNDSVFICKFSSHFTERQDGRWLPCCIHTVSASA